MTTSLKQKLLENPEVKNIKETEDAFYLRLYDFNTQWLRLTWRLLEQNIDVTNLNSPSEQRLRQKRQHVKVLKNRKLVVIGGLN